MVKFWLPMVPAFCLFGCGETSKPIKDIENMGFVAVGSVARQDKAKALDVLTKHGIVTTSDPLNADAIDVVNTDLARATEVLKKDSEDNGYTVAWATKAR